MPCLFFPLFRFLFTGGSEARKGRFFLLGFFNLRGFLFAEVDRFGKVGVFDGFNIGIDAAVEHIDNAGRVNGQGRVMGHHNNSVAGGMNLF